MSDDGVSRADHQKGGEVMDSDPDGLQYLIQQHHPYPTMSTGNAAQCPGRNF